MWILTAKHKEAERMAYKSFPVSLPSISKITTLTHARAIYDLLALEHALRLIIGCYD